MQLSTQLMQINSQYTTFPNLWKPLFMGQLFIVRVPQQIEALQEWLYLELMQARLNYLIAQWRQEISLEETQGLLVTALAQLDPAQEIPLLEPDDDLTDWQQAWAEHLILSNWRFRERLRHYGATFPATPMTPAHPDYPDWQSLHDETELEEWLSELLA